MATPTLSPDRPLVLGSASPRRRELLGGLGLPLRVLPADVAEEPSAGETPERFLERIVAEKLAAVERRLDSQSAVPAVLAADTIVVIDGEILGKPRDADDAFALLCRLAGRSHRVLTRYVISVAPDLGRAARARTVETAVTMRAASAGELRRYAATGEGLDKAGAYAVQGIGSFLVARVEGSPTNVIGLPVCEVVVDLAELGLLDRFP